MGMPEKIDHLLIALAYEEPVSTVRGRVARLLIDTLAELPPTYWAKEHIVLACQAFNNNKGQCMSTDWWLRLCLLRVRDAFLPAGSYNDRATRRNPRIASMSIAELARLLREHLAPFAAA